MRIMLILKHRGFLVHAPCDSYYYVIHFFDLLKDDIG